MRCYWSIPTRSLDGGTLTTPTKGSVGCTCRASESHRVGNRRTCMHTAAGVARKPDILARKGITRQALATTVVPDILNLACVDLLTDVIATACVESETNLDRATMGAAASIPTGPAKATRSRSCSPVNCLGRVQTRISPPSNHIQAP
jgi:hypothetical protein